MLINGYLNSAINNQTARYASMESFKDQPRGKNVLLRSIIGTLPQFVAEDGEDEIMLSVFLYFFH